MEEKGYRVREEKLMGALMAFYVNTFLLAIVNLKLRNRTLGFLLIASLLIFSAFRKNIGTDFESYFLLQKAADVNLDYVYFEPFHKLLFFLGTVTGYEYAYFVLTTLFIFFFLVKILKDHAKVAPELTLIFLTSGFFFYSFNGIRQFMSIIVFLYAVKYLERNLLKYFLYIGLAITVHYSAMILLIVPFVLKGLKKVPDKLFIFIILFSIAFSPVINIAIEFIVESVPVLETYSFYVREDFVEVSAKHFMERLAWVVLAMFLILGTGKNVKNNFYYLVLFGIILRLVLPLSLSRIALDFLMVQMLLFPYLLSLTGANVNRSIRTVVLAFSLILFCTYLLTNTSHIFGIR